MERTPYHDNMDQIEAALQKLPDPHIQIRHYFAPGIYCREMWVPAGAMVTSKIHKTEHQFILSAGALIVRTEQDEEVIIEAPYIGTTYPGTRRVAYFPVASCWTTRHHMDWITGSEGDDPETMEMTVQQIEDELIEPYQNPLIDGIFKNKIQIDNETKLGA